MTEGRYQEILKHLSQYKTKSLNIVENGHYRNHEYKHILPTSQKIENLINSSFKGAMEKYLNSIGKNVHMYFHHLNSSQALALNLFVPLIVTNNLNKIFSLIDQEDIVIDSSFEHVEDTIERTNFDFFIEGRKEKYFFEVKYTEQKFASEVMDNNHLRKYSEVYKPKLDRIAEVNIDDFFNNYQIWRNIIYSETGIVIFVFPKYRSDLKLAIEKAILKMKANHDRIKILHIEDLCDRLVKNESEEIKNHYNEFVKKYLQII